MFDMVVSPELLSILIASLVLFVGLLIIFIRNNKRLKITQRINMDQEKGALNEVIGEHKDSIVSNEGKKSWLKKKELELEQSHSKITMPVYLLILCISVFLIFTISYAIANMFILSVLISFAGIIIPEKIVKSQREKSIDNFNTQFIKALKRISSVVRSGGTPLQGIKDVSESRAIPSIVKLEFKRVLWDIEYGKTIEQAMYSLYERTGSEDVRDIAVIIEIHRKYGGNLPQILDMKAKSISSKRLMESGVRSLLANARSSAYILSGLFGSLGVILFLLSPNYFDPLLQNQGGRLILLLCLSLEVTGVMIIGKFMKVKI